MKQLIILSLLIIAGFTTIQAQHYCFEYDANGNRIKRTIEASPHPKSFTTEEGEFAEEEEAEAEEVLEDKIGTQQIAIFPNPTKGKMKVQVTNMEEGATGSLAVYDIKGQQLLSSAIKSEYTEIDLTAQPPGSYILKITLGTQTKEWKVVKR